MYRMAIVGIGGYAGQIVNHIADLREEGFRLSHAVVRSPAKYPEQMDALAASHPGCEVLPNLHALLTGPNRPDAVILPTGIQYHADMTIQCLEAGLPVLVEKPVAATIQDADRMAEASRKTGLPVAVGFQDLYSPSIRRVKSLAAEGELGLPLSAKAAVRWPRPEEYFKRNDWAGKLQAGGAWVLDSVLNNATAHFFNIAVNLMGEGETQAARPERIVFEAYRAYDIETFDTIALRAELAGERRLCFFSTHACEENSHPVVEVSFEKATVRWQFEEQGLTEVRWKDGRVERFDNGEEHIVKHMLRAVRDLFQQRVSGWASLENSRVHTLVVNGISEFRDRVKTLSPGEYLRDENAKGPHMRRIQGLDSWMERGYREEKLFHEMGAPWSMEPITLDLEGYTCFPSR